MVGYIVKAGRDISVMWQQPHSFQAEMLNMDHGVGLSCDYQRIDSVTHTHTHSQTAFLSLSPVSALKDRYKLSTSYLTFLSHHALKPGSPLFFAIS